MGLLAALEARGLVCVVGAGGKKSTLYALAHRLERAVVTATVRIPPFEARVAEVVVDPDPVAAVERADGWPVGVVPRAEGPDRYEGYPTEAVDRLAEAGVADAVLVKADGARTREFKAPGAREPQVPERADVVLPVASLAAVGEPLDDDRVHRVERVAAVTGREPGTTVRPRDVATVLASPEGGLKDVPAGATAVPVLNKADDADRLATGRTVARRVLETTDPGVVPRVAITRMTADDPLVAVVER